MLAGRCINFIKMNQVLIKLSFGGNTGVMITRVLSRRVDLRDHFRCDLVSACETRERRKVIGFIVWLYPANLHIVFIEFVKVVNRVGSCENLLLFRKVRSKAIHKWLREFSDHINTVL